MSGNFPNITASDRRLCGLPIIGFPSVATPILQFNNTLSAFEWVSITSFTKQIQGGTTYTVVGNVNFISLVRAQGSTTESSMTTPVMAGTFRNLRLRVNTNASTVPVDIILRVNGVDTLLKVTIGAGAVGVFSDLVNTAIVAAGDLVVFRVTASAVGEIVISGGSFEFV